MAILVSVLLPALLHARRASQATVCASHMRQLGMAFRSYVDEHRRFPKTESTPEWRYGGVDFAGPNRVAMLSANRPLNAFYTDRLPSTGGEFLASFRCPADRGLWRAGSGPRNPGPSVIGDQSCYEFYGNSYRANALLMDSTQAGIDVLARPLADHDITVTPARLLVVADAVWYYATRPEGNPESLLDASWHAQPRTGNMAAWDGSVRQATFTPESNSLYTLNPRPATVEAR